MAERCFACGGGFAPADGGAHPYMRSSPGCWAAYGALLAREHQDQALFGAAHRLTVDADALQRPGDTADLGARQSVWVHYAALHLALIERRPFAGIPAIISG